MFSWNLQRCRRITFLVFLVFHVCDGFAQGLNEVIGEGEEVSDLINVEQIRRDELGQELKSSSETLEKQLKEKKSTIEKRLVEWKHQLETINNKIFEVHAAVLRQVSEKTTEYEVLALRAQEQEQILLSKSNEIFEVRSVYIESVNSWRKLVDETFRIYSFSSSQTDSRVPDLPELSKDLLSQVDDPTLREELTSHYQKVQDSRNELLSAERRLQELSLKEHYSVLRFVGRIRSLSMNRLLSLGDNSPYELNAAYLEDLLREAHLVPYRSLALLRAKTIELRGHLKGGIEGFLNLALQGLALVLLLLIPFAFWWAIRVSTRALDAFRLGLLRERKLKGYRVSLLVWIPRATPFVPWLLLLLFLSLTESLLSGTVLAEIEVFIPYVRYYAFYRIFRIVISNVLVFLSSKSHTLKEIETRSKIDLSARSLGVFFFWTMVLLHSVESVVSKALVYQIVLNVVWALTLFYGLWILRRWKDEILAALKLSAHNSRVSQGLVRFSEGPMGLLGRFLGLIWLLLTYMVSLLERWLYEFEFMKRVSARLFRRRLESSQINKTVGLRCALPKDYLDWFGFEVPEDARMLMTPSSEIYQDIQGRFEAWTHDSLEESVCAITGQKGAGKSSLLSLLERKYGDQIEIRRSTIPSKLLTRESVLNFVSELFQLHIPLRSVEDLEKFDLQMPKTLVLLDECQNLYLGCLGGFEGYKTFVELVNARTKNIFWVCIFNQQAWNYLNSAFSKNAYFRTVYRVGGWSEEDIRKLILTRHQLSDYKLSFDQIISAARQATGEVDYAEIETKFFRLLWEQASGNPRAALYYWLSSLSFEGNGKIRVGIPEDDSFHIAHLTDDQLFVLACLVRHENLSSQEMVQAISLDEGLVKHTLKMCMEAYLIERDAQGRYRVSPEAQNSIIRYLRTKNFIYG